MQEEHNDLSHPVYICNFHEPIALHNTRNAQYGSTHSDILDKNSPDDDDH